MKRVLWVIMVSTICGAMHNKDRYFLHTFKEPRKYHDYRSEKIRSQTWQYTRYMYRQGQRDYTPKSKKR